MIWKSLNFRFSSLFTTTVHVTLHVPLLMNKISRCWNSIAWSILFHILPEHEANRTTSSAWGRLQGGSQGTCPPKPCYVLKQDLRQEGILAESNSSENRPDFAESKWIHLVLRGHDGPWQLTRKPLIPAVPPTGAPGDLVITILQATKTHLASTFNPLWIIQKFCKGEDQVLCSTAGTWSWIQVVNFKILELKKKYWSKKHCIPSSTTENLLKKLHACVQCECTWAALHLGGIHMLNSSD